MHYPTKRVSFGKYSFDISDQVYEPAEDTFLFAENLDVRKGQWVLELGTGCGLLTILAAKVAEAVVAVDVNPYSVACSKRNSQMNGVRAKIDFIQSDLFSAFHNKEIFDLILFNAPYLPSEEHEVQSWIERSWAGGANGRQVVDRFISQVKYHLKSDGKVLLMQSTLTGVEETIQNFNDHGLKARIRAERKLPFFETLMLIEANKSS